MKRALLISAVVLGLALPALATDHGIPQADPRSYAADRSLFQQVVDAPDGIHWIYENYDTSQTGEHSFGAYGPLGLDGAVAVVGPPPHLEAAAGVGQDPLGYVTADVRDDGSVFFARATADTVVVQELSADRSSSETFDRFDTPCEAPMVFDEEEDRVWFNCGPLSFDYRTGGAILYAESYDVIAAQPDGGVVGVIGQTEPTIAFISTTSADLFDLPELPIGSLVEAAVADADNGVAVLFSTTCAMPCELDPASPDEVSVEADDLVDFFLVWVGWDGEVDDGFGVVPVGTGPSYILSEGQHRAQLVRVNDSLVVSFPPRNYDSDDGLWSNPWVRVHDDGAIDGDFAAASTLRSGQSLDLIFDGTLLIDATEDAAGSHLTWWHLTDQGRFFDDSGQFEDEIEALADAGVTLGCNTDGTLFCPEDIVNRGQMASFIARWLGLPLDAPDRFADDDGSTHEAAINAVADAGITVGCSTTDPTLFCPDAEVTRGQMASFIKRALGLPDDLTNRFTDDDGSTHERAIDAIATEGITLGCDESGTLFCPNNPVQRKHMAAFLVRAGL